MKYKATAERTLLIETAGGENNNSVVVIFTETHLDNGEEPFKVVTHDSTDQTAFKVRFPYSVNNPSDNIYYIGLTSYNSNDLNLVAPIKITADPLHPVIELSADGTEVQWAHTTGVGDSGMQYDLAHPIGFKAPAGMSVVLVNKGQGIAHDTGLNVVSDVHQYLVDVGDQDDRGLAAMFYMSSDGDVWDYVKSTYEAKASADGDGDGVADDQDVFPNDAKEWGDKDGDGVGDNSDAFPLDPGLQQAVAQDPLFTSEPVTSAYEEIDYSYYITTDVDPLDAPVLSGTSLPVWLKLTDNGDGTGTLSGTPQSGNLGVHSILLEALQPVRVTHIYSSGTAGGGAFAALRGDGSVVTWGNLNYGGDSSTVAGDLRAGVKQIYSSSHAFAAIKDDGSVVKWGNLMDPAQLDHGGDSSAVADDLSSGVTQIYSTGGAFAALKEDGSVVTWGASYSTAGAGWSHVERGSAVADGLSAGVTQIYSNPSAFAAVKEDGSVVTWGYLDNGGDSSAVADDLSSGVTQIYSTRSAFAAVKEDGSVVTWGYLDNGGDSSAVADDLSSGVTQIYSTRSAFAAVKEDGSVVTWGYSEYGGDSSAVADDLSAEVTKIYSTAYAFAAVKEDGSVVTWGSSDNGGDSSAVADDLSAEVTKIYSNHVAFAALKEDGSVVTWGAWVSLLGYDLGSGVIQIYSTFYAFAALKDDDSVVTWGMNYGGGDSSAVADDLSSGITQIIPTTYAFAAMKKDGSVVTWGGEERFLGVGLHGNYGQDSSAVADDLNPSMVVLDSQEFVITVEPFGEPVTYTNIATTLIGQVTINGTAAREGDVVAFYVGAELRGKQAVNIDINGRLVRQRGRPG